MPGPGTATQETCQHFWAAVSFELGRCPSDLGPGVAQRSAFSSASCHITLKWGLNEGREQFCYCINFIQLIHLRN